MRQEDLRGYLKAAPFAPFRLHLSSGAFFDVRQPQLVELGRSTFTIGFPVEVNQQRFVTIALIHIVWIEALVPAP